MGKKNSDSRQASANRSAGDSEEIFSGKIRTDKVMCCPIFRKLFPPHAEISFKGSDIFCQGENGDKIAFVAVSSPNGRGKISIPLKVIELSSETRRILQNKYNIPRYCLEKFQVAQSRDGIDREQEIEIVDELEEMFGAMMN
ncbi:MAG: hypothetical protein WC545_03695 [Patescibacteria group bacterium]